MFVQFNAVGRFRRENGPESSLNPSESSGKRMQANNHFECVKLVSINYTSRDSRTHAGSVSKALESLRKNPLLFTQKGP